MSGKRPPRLSLREHWRRRGGWSPVDRLDALHDVPPGVPNLPDLLSDDEYERIYHQPRPSGSGGDA